MNSIEDFSKEELYKISLQLIKEIRVDYLTNESSGFAYQQVIVDKRGVCDYCGSIDCGDGDVIASHIERRFKFQELWDKLKDY